MSYMVHEWMNNENPSERLEMLVFSPEFVLANETIDWELPEDFNYLKFDLNNIKHQELAKEYHELLYEKFGRLVDNMTCENYLTNSCKLPDPKELKSYKGEES